MRVEDLYSQHIGHATRLAYLLTGDRSTAEDVAQEAFVRCASKVPVLRNQHSFGRYLRRAVVREVQMQARARGRERQRQERAFEPVALSAGALPLDERIACRSELALALEQLSPRQRTVVVLRFWDDLSESETARIMRCSRGTVKSTSARALVRLREVMERTQDEPN